MLASDYYPYHQSQNRQARLHKSFHRDFQNEPIFSKPRDCKLKHKWLGFKEKNAHWVLGSCSSHRSSHIFFWSVGDTHDVLWSNNFLIRIIDYYHQGSLNMAISYPNAHNGYRGIRREIDS
jgi:hypothetical protein